MPFWMELNVSASDRGKFKKKNSKAEDLSKQNDLISFHKKNNNNLQMKIILASIYANGAVPNLGPFCVDPHSSPIYFLWYIFFFPRAFWFSPTVQTADSARVYSRLPIDDCWDGLQHPLRNKQVHNRCLSENVPSAVSCVTPLALLFLPGPQGPVLEDMSTVCLPD